MDNEDIRSETINVSDDNEEVGDIPRAEGRGEGEDQAQALIDEDARSGDNTNTALQFTMEEDDESRGAETLDKIVFEEEGQSLDAISVRSEEVSRQSGGDGGESNDVAEESEVSVSNDKIATNSENRETSSRDESDSNSRTSTSKQNEVTLDENKDFEGSNNDIDLHANETLVEEDEESENVVAEVDISAMMEISMDEESQNSQTHMINNEEPEVIPIDSDDDEPGEKEKSTEGYDASQHVVLQNVYEVDEDENVTEMDISSMMQVEVAVGEGPEESQTSDISVVSTENTSIGSRRPRRAAAEAAAKTIHQISSEEQGIPSRVFRHRRKSQEDDDYTENQPNSDTSQGGLQKCQMCKKSAPCSIVIRQYGSDMFLCSNTCFSKFRNQGKECKSKTLPCSKCGIMEGDVAPDLFLWETMNFCSDLCVGRYQMDVGSKCCTCGNNVPWGSLGKYCVRFGSDIRQFCVPQCLEGYKKNARVCFNCQLDIRRVGNIILANIPSKSAPKEFCSNDCVEMYCDRNLHQPTRAKPQPEGQCAICQIRKIVHKEIVLAIGSFKVCSDVCWQAILKMKGVVKPEKCEICAKFVNMDLEFTTPIYWLSTVDKVFGFCSRTCKNLYILNSRKILSCTTCKVKKYNYDLVEYFTNARSAYAICSLACLPKSTDHLNNIRDVLFLPQLTSDKNTPSALALGNQSVPVISSVISMGEYGPTTRRKSRNRLSSRNEQISFDVENDTEIEIGNPESFLDALTAEELDAILSYIDKPPPEMKSKACSAKPRTCTVETQTDVSELNDMGRIPLKTNEIVHYVPVPIPCLIDVPFPGYFLESAVPIPFPIPIPFPVPIPVIFKTESKSSSPKDSDDEPKSKDSSTPPPLDKNTDSIAQNGNQLISAEPSNPTNQSQPPNFNSNSVMPSHQANLLSENIVPTQHFGSPTPVTPSPNQCVSTPVAYSQHLPYQSPSYSTIPPDTGLPSYAPSPSPCFPQTSNPSPISYGSPVAPMPPVLPSQVPTYSYTASGGSYNTRSIAPVIGQSSPVGPTPLMPNAGGYGMHSSPTYDYMRGSPVTPPVPVLPQNTAPKIARVEYAMRAWKMMFGGSSDPRSISSAELSSKLTDLVNRGSKPNGERYRADIILYIALGIQQMLRDSSRVDKIFYDSIYYNFVLAFTECAERELTVGIHASLEDTHFWETSELGASSPGVLLFTLIYMFLKHFGLKTWEMHAALQFSHIVLTEKYDPCGMPFKTLTVVGFPGAHITEVIENRNFPERCLIKVYEFYRMMSESVDGPFYKCLRHDYTPRTPWFNRQQLEQLHIYQMLVRASSIKSVNNLS